MAQLKRTLTFLTSDLGKNAALVLTFDKTTFSGQYKSAFHRVWKVGNFAASGQNAFTVECRTEFGFVSGLSAPLDPSAPLGLVYAYTHINPGEKTILSEGGNPPAHFFSKPTPLQPVTDKMVAQNDARPSVDMGFGIFQRSDRPPTETLLFEGINRGSSVEVEVTTPTLDGYVSLDYNYSEGEILPGPIPFDVVFSQDLATLDQDTFWKLEFNAATGKYVTTRSL